MVTHMSLDHDLGASYICEVCQEAEFSGKDCFPHCTCACHDAVTPTGYDLVRWMITNDRWPVYKPMVHSANPVGAKRMREDIEKFWHPPNETTK